ncbi:MULTISPECIES: hypothetical protein [Mesorhizobium]|uniref:hypothetical protein n=1 Tax=Mesorhizobium TaxID=68287 RepID=UPI001140D44A|nr:MULTISPECIES: hypothetical protein [Mesorhizobium]QIA25460.1 hypothetical protein A9K68_029885 [Mesorhizobium sp. AA22]
MFNAVLRQSGGVSKSQPFSDAAPTIAGMTGVGTGQAHPSGGHEHFEHHLPRLSMSVAHLAPVPYLNMRTILKSD